MPCLPIKATVQGKLLKYVVLLTQSLLYQYRLLQDAYLLANILAKAVTTRPAESISISGLTEIYTTIRQPVANFVQKSSRDQGLIYQFNGPGFEDVQEGDEVSPDKLAKLLHMIEKGWEWVSISPMGDITKALAMV